MGFAVLFSIHIIAKICALYFITCDSVILTFKDQLMYYNTKADLLPYKIGDYDGIAKFS